MDALRKARVLQVLSRGRRAIHPLALHPRAGTAGGLLLVAALVPILTLWHGERGPFGQSIPLFFLIPVLLASAVGGRGAGAIVSCAALASWDWFFITPLYTVTIASVRDLLALAVFLAVAMLVGQLSVVARRRTAEALLRASSSEALYELTLALIASRNRDDALPLLTERLRTTFDLAACAVLLPEAQSGGWRTESVAGRLPGDLRVEESRSLAVTVARVFTSGEERILGHVRRGPGQSERMVQPRPGQERARFLPLLVGSRAIGVLEVVPRGNQKPDPEREHLLATFANGAAIALEQARLSREEQTAAVARESDRLKSVLLSSVSHDLRTPLAGIKAASSSLLQPDISWSEADREMFLQDIDHEADRLTRLVSNFLDLSRIETGAITPDKEWEDLNELVERVLRRLAPQLATHPLLRQLTALPPVRVDAVQIEQVLTNLIENAIKYSPQGTPITVQTGIVRDQSEGQRIRIAVSDKGPGIPAAEQERIFDRFYRVTEGVRGVSGTGMGLAIVKGLVEAHGGNVRVESTPGAGSTFSVLLPVDEARTGDARAQRVGFGEGLPR